MNELKQGLPTKDSGQCEGGAQDIDIHDVNVTLRLEC